jgi:hypothetical protein
VWRGALNNIYRTEKVSDALASTFTKAKKSSLLTHVPAQEEVNDYWEQFQVRRDAALFIFDVFVTRPLLCI